MGGRGGGVTLLWLGFGGCGLCMARMMTDGCGLALDAAEAGLGGVAAASVADVSRGSGSGGLLVGGALWGRRRGLRLVWMAMRRFGEERGRQKRQDCKRQEGR